MRLGTDLITIFSREKDGKKDKWIKHVISGVFWQVRYQRALGQDGSVQKFPETLIMFAPSSEYTPKTGDVVFRGKVLEEYSTGLKNKLEASFTINEVSDQTDRRLPHWEVSGS